VNTPDAVPPIAQFRKRSTATEDGHKWNALKISAKRAPAEHVIWGTATPRAAMKGVICCISAVRLARAFLFRRFARARQPRRPQLESLLPSWVLILIC
jgi:hypothetical protein